MKLESTLQLRSPALDRDIIRSGELSRESSAKAEFPRKAMNLLVSLVIHGVLLVLLATLPFLVTEEPELPPQELKMDMVLVRMPTPEPPGSKSGGGAGETQQQIARPKALARRAFAANVSQFKSVVQQQVTQVQPNPVFGEVTKVQVDPTVRTQAPKSLTQRVVQQATTVEALQVSESRQASAVSTEAPTLRQAPNVVQSAGPRAVNAAGPVISKSDAVDYQQATIADGVADSVTVQGDSTGPRVRSLDTGNGQLFGRGLGKGGGSGAGGGNGDGDGMGNGTGSGIGDGSGSGGGKDCNSDPACSAYLELIRQRVYQRWNPDRNTPIGKVRLAFRIDKSGSAHGIKLVNSENAPLGDSCMVAFQHASPFPPPPPSIAYILNKNLIATFDFADKR